MNNALLFIGGLLVAAFAALFAVPHFIDWNGYRGVFEEEASRILGREVRVGGSVNVRLLPTPYMRFEKIRLADTTGGTGEPFFRADSFTALLSIGPLLKGILEAHEVQLTRPELNVSIDQAGRPSWGTLRVTPGSLPFVPTGVTLQSVTVVDGAVSLHSPDGRQVARVGAINGELAADAIEGPYKFNGTVDWQGNAREVKLVTAAQDADGGLRFKTQVRAPATENLYVFDGRAVDLNMRPRIEGELTAKVAVGKAAAPPEPAAPGSPPQAQAPAQAPSVKVSMQPDPAGGPSFELKARIEGSATGADLKDIALTFEQGGQPQIVAGEARAMWGAEPRLDVSLNSRWLDLDRLAGAAQDAGPLEIARRLATSLAALLPREAATRVRFTVDQVSLGGEAVSGLKAALERSNGPLELKELIAGLPGGSRLELGGMLTEPDPKAAPGFSGTLALRGASLARFLSWAAKGSALVEGRSDGPFSLQGQLVLSDKSVELTEAMAELAGVPLTGEVRYGREGRDGRQSISLSLEGQEIDAAALWARGVGLEEMRAALLGTRPAGDGGERGGKSWFDPARSDLHLKLRAAQLKLSTNLLRDVNADVVIEGGRLTLPALTFATEAGLTIEADGDVAGLAEQPRGRINWLLAAPTGEALADLARILDPTETRGLERSAASLVPLRLAGSARFGGRTANAVDLELDGVVQGGRVVASVRLDGGYKDWRSAPAEVSARIDSPDVARLLGALREKKVAAAPSASPRAATINVNASGVPAKGLLALAGVEADGLSLGYDGSLGLPGEDVRELNGRLRIAARDAKDVLALVGLSVGGAAGLALDGTLEVTSKDNAYTLKPRPLTVGSAAVSGQLTVTRSPDAAPRIAADLDIGEVSVAGLLAAFLERRPPVDQDDLAGAEPSAWPEQPFDLSILDGVEGQVRLGIGKLSLDGPLALTEAKLEATLSPTQVKVTRLEGRALDGTFRSTLTLDRATAGVGLSGNLRLEGAKLESLAAPGAPARASGGPVSATLTFSGRALSPSALIGSLRGQGQIEIGPSHLKGLTPRTVTATADAVLGGKAEPGGEGLVKALAEGLRQGDLALGPRRVPLQLADGALRLEAFAIDAEEGRTRVETTVDLTSLKLDSEWKLEPKPRPRAGGKTAALPPVSVVYVGALKSLAALEPRISAGSLERELAVRKMENEVDQLEKLRKLDEERRTKEIERQRAIETERLRAPPVAAPAVPPPAPIATPPRPPDAAAVPPPPAATTLPAPATPPVGSMPASVGATPLPPVPPAPDAQAAEAVPAPQPTPRPSGLTRQPPKDLSPGEIIKRTFGF